MATKRVAIITTPLILLITKPFYPIMLATHPCNPQSNLSHGSPPSKTIDPEPHDQHGTRGALGHPFHIGPCSVYRRAWTGTD